MVSTTHAGRNQYTAFTLFSAVALVCRVCLAGLPGQSVGAGFDDFEAYATGADLPSQGSWARFADDTNVGPQAAARPCCGTWGLVGANGPGARQHHALAYDSAREVVVLFGGSDSSGYQGDTWEWNGVHWSLIPTTTSPSPRNEHAMAFDSDRGLVVLFGGGNDNSPEAQGETWEYPVAGQWVRRAHSAGPGATLGPSPRVRHAMAYDRARQRVVLFGGYDGGLVDQADTWEWDGTSWTPFATEGPSARESHALSFDSARGKVVLFGGFDGDRLADTWERTGTSWASVATTGPSGRSDHAMVYADTCGTVLFGGYSRTGRTGDTWQWDGSQWTQLAVAGPSARNGHKMAYDSTQRRSLFFGGYDDGGVNGETWETSPCPAECVPAPANLALWLPLDETTDTTSANLAPGGNPGTRVNDPLVVDGYVLRSLSFDGSSRYVSVPDYPAINPGTGDFAFDAWVKRDPNSGTGVRVIFDKRDPASGIGYHLGVSFGNLVLRLTDASGSTAYRDTGTLPADNQWHFVAVTVSRTLTTGGRFYIDGQLSGTFDPTDRPGSLTNPNSFWVGASPSVGNSPWLGGLDEVEVFNRALTASELQAIFDAGSSGKCKPPEPPVIIVQPMSQTVTQGESVTFSVHATGSLPLSYQWFLNDAAIPGAIGDTYTITNALLPYAGVYSVVVTNPFGTATSVAAPLTVMVNFHVWVKASADFTDAQAQLVRQGAVILEATEYFHRITCLISSAELDAIASLSVVRATEPVFQPLTYNLWSRHVDNAINVQANPANIASAPASWKPWGYPNNFNLTGDGVHIGVWDGAMPFPHPDFAGRLTLMEPDCTHVNFGPDAIQHPTHVIGTLAGDGSLLASCSFAGMAPLATIEAWDDSSPNPNICGTGNDPSTEMLAARTLILPPPVTGHTFPILGTMPIALSQNSWGYPPFDQTTCANFGSYLNLCADYDKLVWDTDLPIFFAAGNFADTGKAIDGTQCVPFDPIAKVAWRTVTPIATAKNVVAVGAIDQSDKLTVFSSCGPTTDGRLKPDVVALGWNVISAAKPRFPVPDPFNSYSYLTESGTSQAAPAVSGVAALLIEQFRKSNSTDPTAALLKAVLCNTATDLGKSGPDFKYGYGKVNAVAAATVIREDQYSEVKTGLQTGGSWTTDIAIPPGSCTALKVLVAWTDCEYTGDNSPNAQIVSKLVNDLDLVVIGPGGSYYPFTLNASLPDQPATTPSSGNHLDNVEQVVIPNPAAGTYTIQISGPSVPQGPQPFAVTWWLACPPPPFFCPPQLTEQPIKGLFNTGVDDNGKVLPAGTVDPHYRLILSPIPQAGPDAVTGCGSKSPASERINPVPPSGINCDDAPQGTYIYELEFDLACADVATARITGRWLDIDDWGEINLNGHPIGASFSESRPPPFTFTISSGFQKGLNKLQFVTHNNCCNTADPSPTGMRVELSGTACYYTPTTATPLGVHSACPGESVTLSTTASGPGPFTYVWKHNDVTIPGATGSSYIIPAALNADAGTYCVTVTGTYPGNAVPTCGTITQCGGVCVGTPPTATPLTSLRVCAGQSATFSSVTSGGSAGCGGLGQLPIIYWSHNGKIFVGGGATYQIPFVTLADAGTYCLTIISQCGTVSQCATLEVDTPLIDVPADLTEDCDDQNGVIVSYGLVTATSPCCWLGVSAPPTCTPASGSRFPIGVTPVTCTVTDACGNSATNTFTVTVRGKGGSDWKWARRDGGVGAESGNAVAVDPWGNVCVAGNYAAPSSFGPDYGGGQNIWVAKYDAQGKLLWTTAAGGTQNDIARGIAVDGSGNVFVTGSFQSSGGGSGPYGLTSAGLNDVFVSKYDPLGNLLWSQRFGGTGNDSGFGIAVDNTGNCYVAGEFQSSFVVGTTKLTSLGAKDALVVKYDSSGAVLWAVQAVSAAGLSSLSTARAIAVDASGDAYLAGALAGEVAFGANSVVRNGSATAFVAKYHYDSGLSVGDWTWANHSGHSTASGDHDGRGIGVDAHGFCYVTAYFNGTVNYGLNAAGSAVTVSNNKTAAADGQRYDYLIAKFDANNGSPVWVVPGGGDTLSDDETRALAVDGAGNCYVTGFLYPGAPSRFISAGQNLLVAKYDSLGVQQWGSAPSGTVTDNAPDNVGLGIAADAAGCVHVTGAFSESLDIPGLSTLVDSSASATDVFVARLCPNCGPQVPQPPLPSELAITDQPVDQVQIAGSAAIFGVGATGTALTYQWQFNNHDLVNETNATLVLTNLSIESGGRYAVRVANGSGSVVSAQAQLTVRLVPATLGAVQDKPISSSVTKLLANNTLHASYPLSLVNFNEASLKGGSLVLGDGQLTYSPPPGYVGSDEFIYTVTDGHGASATGNVLVTITSPNNPSGNRVISLMPIDNGWALMFAGIPGRNYILQVAGAANGPWVDLSGAVLANSTGLVPFTDETTPPMSMRFYRVRSTTSF